MTKPAERRLEARLEHKLRGLRQRGALRKLSSDAASIDFYSNDYLGLARSPALRLRVEELRKASEAMLGSTGSRLISGNSDRAEQLEARLAAFHLSPAALLFSSGYAANSGLFSTIASLGDSLVMDRLVHASSIDGARLSRAEKFIFEHNNINSLKECIDKAYKANPDGNVIVGVESLYSMDGDFAPLEQIARVCEERGAELVVDEAHSNGVSGPGGRGCVVECGLENDVFARVMTFGKGLGLHGAVVLGSNALREYLVNHCRPFIFSTAPSDDSLLCIEAACELVKSADDARSRLRALIQTFRQQVSHSSHDWLPSDSWIQSLLVPGNQQALAMADHLQSRGFAVKAIRAPSVAAGSERIRICLHAFNTPAQIEALFKATEEPACKAALLSA